MDGNRFLKELRGLANYGNEWPGLAGKQHSVAERVLSFLFEATAAGRMANRVERAPGFVVVVFTGEDDKYVSVKFLEDGSDSVASAVE